MFLRNVAKLSLIFQDTIPTQASLSRFSGPVKGSATLKFSPGHQVVTGDTSGVAGALQLLDESGVLLQCLQAHCVRVRNRGRSLNIFNDISGMMIVKSHT